MGSVHDTTSLQLPVNTSSLGDSGNFDFHASVTSNNIDSTDFGFEYDNTETLAQRVIQQTATTLTVRNSFEGGGANTKQGGKRSIIELTSSSR